MKPTENLSRNTQAVAETLAAMIERESITHSCSSHEGCLNFSDPKMVTADDRLKLVDWCYDIADYCNLSRETVASAMEMADRFLSLSCNADDDVAQLAKEALEDHFKFQHLTVTALYTSIKLNEKVAISSDLFVDMCSQAYSVEEIEDMERELLNGLSWRCHAPTAFQVGLSILSLLLPYVDIPEAIWGFVMDEMKYLIELSVRDYYFSTQRTSTVALAAILKAISDTCNKELQELFGTYLLVIMECFDFESGLILTEVRSRFQTLTKLESAVLQEEEDFVLMKVKQV